MRRICQVCLRALALLCGALCVTSPCLATDTELQVSGAAIQAHADFLASDLLEGRATGSRGYDLAAAYVAAQFRQYGLKPVGDSNSYLQRVPLVEATVVLPGSAVSIKHESITDNFEFGSDYLPAANFFSSPVALTAPLAFAGFGITAPEYGYDDIANVDLQGRIAVILQGAPKRFRAATRDYYAWRDIKYANLIRHGAVAVIEIMMDESPLESSNTTSSWERAVALSWVSDMRRLNGDDEPVEPFPELKLKLRFNASAASRLFTNSHPWEQVLSNAVAGTPQGFALPGSMTLSATTGLRHIESNNVVAVIAGSDPELRREYVLVTANLDHLGRGAAVNGDSIYNGLQHNAAGVAMMLELARSIMMQPQRPLRSIVFAAVTAGEKSAQGIQQFLKSGPIAANNIVAAVSLNTPLPLLRTNDVLAIGSEQSSLGKTLITVAQRAGLRLSTADNADDSLVNGELVPLVQAGIPTLGIINGIHARNARTDMHGLKRDYLLNHFDQPSDDASNAAFDVDAARELTLVSAYLTLAVANDSTRPIWYRSSVLHNKLRH